MTFRSKGKSRSKGKGRGSISSEGFIRHLLVVVLLAWSQISLGNQCGVSLEHLLPGSQPTSAQFEINLDDPESLAAIRAILDRDRQRVGWEEKNLGRGKELEVQGIQYFLGRKLSGELSSALVFATTSGQFVVKRYERTYMFKRELFMTKYYESIGIPVAEIRSSDPGTQCVVKPYLPGTDASILDDHSARIPLALEQGLYRLKWNLHQFVKDHANQKFVEAEAQKEALHIPEQAFAESLKPDNVRFVLSRSGKIKVVVADP